MTMTVYVSEQYWVGQKVLFEFFSMMIWENANKLFGQPSIWTWEEKSKGVELFGFALSLVAVSSFRWISTKPVLAGDQSGQGNTSSVSWPCRCFVSFCLCDNSSSDLTFTIPSFSLVTFSTEYFLGLEWKSFNIYSHSRKLTHRWFAVWMALPFQRSCTAYANRLETFKVQRKQNLHAWLGSRLQIGWGWQNELYGSIAQHFLQRNPKMSRLSLPLTVNWNIWGGQFGNIYQRFRCTSPSTQGFCLELFRL